MPRRSVNMKKDNRKKVVKSKRTFSESQIDRWLQETDLTKLDFQLKPVSFKSLVKTDWGKFYEDQQKSVPVSIRLPVFFLTKIKQEAIQKGIPYQMLLKVWLAEKLNEEMKSE